MLTTRQAADALGMTPRRVRALLESGRLIGEKLTPRFWLVDEKSVEEYANSERKAGRPPTK